MKLLLHSPRPSEAETAYSKDEGLTIIPRFFASRGTANGVNITVMDNDNNEIQRYSLVLNATTAELKLCRLREVLPAYEVKRTRDVAK